MEGFKRLSLLLAVLVCSISAGSPAWDKDLPDRTATIPGVSIQLGALKITSKVIEMRCEVRNDSEQDVWIMSDRDEYGVTRTNAVLYLDTDGQTLVVLRRKNVPKYGEIYADPGHTRYDRLPAGQSRPEVLSVALPTNVYCTSFFRGFIKPESSDAIERRGFLQLEERRAMVATRLAFEIGCYTDEFVSSMLERTVNRPYGLRLNDSQTQVVLVGYPFGWVWRQERAVRMTIEGISIPYGDWLDFKRPPARNVPILSRFSLFKNTESQKQEPELEPTSAEIMEDLFNNFSMGLEEYRYAKALFAFDEKLFNESAQAVADVYLALGRGQFPPEELPRRLNYVASQYKRERILAELQAGKAQASPDK